MSNSNQSLCTCGCCTGSTHHTPLSVENAPGLSALQYRVGTRSSFKQSMLHEIAKKQVLSRLTARYDDDMAIATLDAWATVLDVISFYQERIINEGYLRTSTERLSVLELARHISYKPAPGLAAGTFLSFTMNESPGNPLKVKIPERTKVQSIPGQDESPQLFETIEDFEARVEWNSIPVQTTKKVFPKRHDKSLYLQGISTGLQPGDAILIIGDEVKADTTKENWDFRRIKEVLPDNEAGYTKVTWQQGLGKNNFGKEILPASENVRVYAMKQKALLFGYNAPDFRTISESVRKQFLPGGLKAEYYNDVAFGTKVLTRTDSTINFNWGAGSPSLPLSTVVNNDNFSARWRGHILSPVTGPVKFYTVSDDGVKLWVNGQVVIENWTDHAVTENSGTITLQAGQLYDIRLDYYERGEAAVIKLFWEATGILKEIIPAKYLFQPGDYADWPDFTISAIATQPDTICLDNLYPKIMAGNWVLVSKDSYEEIYLVKKASESSRNNFTLTSKTTILELEGEQLRALFDIHVRDAVVYAQSEEFQVADTPVEEPISNQQEISLQNRVPGLEKGKKIIISGKRKRLVIPDNDAIDGKFRFEVENNEAASRLLRTGDSLIFIRKEIKTAATYVLLDTNGEEGTFIVPNAVVNKLKLELSPAEKEDTVVSELHTIALIKTDTDTTEIVTENKIENEFDPATTVVYANVAEATHGETRTEVLGSGDGSRKFQKFELKQNPLTFISAASATGSASTLEIRVNDILWNEVSTFYLTKPTDKIYTVHINDDGKVTLMFGDGITGARLPTGIENVKAVYRVGTGVQGSVDENKLTMLLTPQIGLNKVNNPVAASGGEDPETFSTAKKNAPLTVLTLDRIVSAKDFEDFTRAFAGIAKAAVELLWNGEQQTVHITFATEDKTPIDTGSALYINLIAAVKNAGHANEVIRADNYKPVFFSVTAGIKINTGFLFEVVKADVQQALKDAFSFDARDFGQDVTPAEVIAVIQGVQGVLYTDLNLLDETDPFTVPDFRLSSERSKWKDDDILPAELYTINEKKIDITLITP